MPKKVSFRHISVKLYESPLKSKKYRAIFFYDGRQYHHADFGGKGYRDFTLINDPDSRFFIENPKDRAKVREQYIRRHEGDDEDWDDPFTAGSLSRWVLWERPTLAESWNFFKKRFGFK